MSKPDPTGTSITTQGPFPITRRTWVVATLGLALSLTGFFVALNREANWASARFNARVAEYMAKFQERRNGVEAVLSTLRAILHQNPDLNEPFFHEIMDSLSNRLDVVEALAWAPRVRESERAAFEATIRAHGPAEFEIREGDLLHGAAVRAQGPKLGDSYFPTLFIHPLTGNEHAIGYDLASVEGIRLMLEEIRGNGEVGVSEVVNLPIDGKQAKVVVAAVGVYRDTLTLADRASADDQLLGFALAAVKLQGSLNALEQRFGAGAPLVFLSALPGGTNTQETPLAASSGLLRQNPDLKSLLQHYTDGTRMAAVQQNPSIARRQWRFRFEPGPGILQGPERWLPHAVLCVGLLCTGLVVQYIHGSQVRTLRIEATVRRRTAELATANSQLQDEIKGRLKAQEDLARERNLLRTLLDRLPDAVHVVDTAGRYLMFNEAHARLLQVDNERQGVGQNVRDVGQPALAATLDAGSKAAMSLGTAELGRETRIRLSPEREIILLTSRLPLRDARGDLEGLVVLARDVTEIRRAAVEQEQFTRRLQETQKLESLGLLAGGIAHDFNNLLTSILGNVGLARMELPAGSAVQDSLIQIENTTVRAADLCRQMLAYSGKGRLVIRRLDLSAMIEETTELLRLSISKKASLKLQLARGLPSVSGDPTQLRQILMNLVINASDAIGDRPGMIRIATGTVQADRTYLSNSAFSTEAEPGTFVYLEINDDGCGMSPETVTKIFDPFFTTKFTGRGLGLAAVLGIVRGHRGAMKVYSEPGKGSTFKLLLPKADGPADRDRIQSAPEGWQSHGTILLVDDEEAVRLVAARLLQKAGLQVDQAADGREGVEKFSASPDRYRAVLLDLTMPHMDGEEAFRMMRQLRPDVRVLLMSGFSHQEANDRFCGKGLGGFIQKPFGPQELYDALRAVIEAPAPPAE